MITAAHRELTRARPALTPAALLALLVALAAALWPAATPAATAASPASPASAPSHTTVAGLTVQAAWIRWLPAELPAGGYLTLTNRGDRPLLLTSASSAAYREITLHRTVKESGMSKMVKVASITIPAHSTLDFAASGYHLMLTHQWGAVSPGHFVRITLHFEGGQAQAVDFEVRPPNGSAPQQNMNGMSSMPGMPDMPH